ncbi:MAG: hypothetical protein P8Z40_12920 [Chloroflexota bacterium]
MGERREGRRLVVVVGAVLALAALACVCGGLTNVGGRVVENIAESTLEAGMGTIEAGLTEIVPTLEAAQTEIGPTLEAAQTEIGPTLEVQLTQGIELPEEIPGALSQWAVAASASSQYGEDAYSANQATGEPDTPECGDIRTAWASANSSGIDWLRVEYETPVIPVRIAIYETYNPGAIVKVETVNENGEATTVYQAEAAPVEDCPRVLEVQALGTFEAVNAVVISLDQSNHTGWDEIDAVELVGIPAQ